MCAISASKFSSFSSCAVGVAAAAVLVWPIRVTIRSLRGRGKLKNAKARRVVVYAQEEARMLNQNYIGTEHLLLGILRARGQTPAPGIDEDWALLMLAGWFIIRSNMQTTGLVEAPQLPAIPSQG